MPPDALICTKFKIFWGFAPDPTGGAYSAPPDLLAGLRGAASGEGRRSLLSHPTFQLVPTPDRKGIWPVKKLDVWELCTSHSSSCYHHLGYL